MDLLFKSGSTFNAYPLKIVFLSTPVELQYPAQAMFVAPKKSFRKSPDRNLLKRRMREAYRQQKGGFYEALGRDNTKMLMAFIYTAKKEEVYTVIEQSIQKLLQAALKKKRI